MCVICSGDSVFDIVTQLASNKKLISELKGIYNFEYKEDVLQDIFLQIIEKEPKEKILALCKNNQMKYFLVNILKMQVMSPTSKNNYNYKNRLIGDNIRMKSILMDDTGKEVDWDLNQLQEWVNVELDKMEKESGMRGKYNKIIFLKVVESDKTFKELEKEMNINRNNIFYTYNKVRKHLKETLKKFYL